MFTPSLAQALAVWDNLKAGETAITNDETLDALAAYFTDQDTADARAFFGCLATTSNPKRIGVLDQYIAALVR